MNIYSNKFFTQYLYEKMFAALTLFQNKQLAICRQLSMNLQRRPDKNISSQERQDNNRPISEKFKRRGK